jgi:hypothetical protein
VAEPGPQYTNVVEDPYGARRARGALVKDMVVAQRNDIHSKVGQGRRKFVGGVERRVSGKVFASCENCFKITYRKRVLEKGFNPAKLRRKIPRARPARPLKLFIVSHDVSDEDNPRSRRGITRKRIPGREQ